MSCRLDRAFFDVPCHYLAKNLLGQRLCRRLNDQIVKGTIVETEMYPGKMDNASHSFIRMTERNRAMFMAPGTAYVYIIYGVYYCFNISSQDEGGAVLIRALEPFSNTDLMRSQRTLNSRSTLKRILKDHELCNGPSKLCSALGITKMNCNEIDLVDSDQIWLEKGVENEFDVFNCGRIGLEGRGPEAVNKLYRFYVRNNRSVSVLDKEDEFRRNKRNANHIHFAKETKVAKR